MSDNQKEAARRAEEAKRKLEDQRKGETAPAAVVPGTPRPGMIPIDQTAERQAAEGQLAVQEEAEEREAEVQAVANYNAAQDAADAPDVAADINAIKPKKGEKMIEVLLERKYAPHKIANDEGELVAQGELKKTLPAGTTVKLPQAEALRAMQLGIAKPTNAAFDE